MSRAGATATVTVDNFKDGDIISIYRADDYKGNFSLLTRIDTESWQDTGLDLELNYKYKASIGDQVGIGVLSLSDVVLSETDFVLSAGDLAEDVRSASKYTKGE